MTPFELPPQSPDERDRRLALLEAREEHRELDMLDADRAFDKWPASRRHDFETTTAEDAAAFERARSPDREVRIGSRRMSIDDVPGRTEL